MFLNFSFDIILSLKRAYGNYFAALWTINDKYFNIVLKVASWLVSLIVYTLWCNVNTTKLTNFSAARGGDGCFNYLHLIFFYYRISLRVIISFVSTFHSNNIVASKKNPFSVLYMVWCPSPLHFCPRTTWINPDYKTYIFISLYNSVNLSGTPSPLISYREFHYNIGVSIQ